MAQRTFKLQLESHGREIYYNLEYEPPVKSCGGYLGSIHPGGHLHGLEYDALEKLGNGLHAVELDDHDPSDRGNQEVLSADNSLVSAVSFALFMEKVGAATFADAVCTILRSFNANTADAIYLLLDERYRSDLNDFARSIPRFRFIRRLRPIGILTSNGFERLSDENLDAIRRHFLKDNH